MNDDKENAIDVNEGGVERRLPPATREEKLIMSVVGDFQVPTLHLVH
jgi:hypothetical protein